MNFSSITLVTGFIALSLVIVHDCSADSTKTQLQEQETGNFNPAKTPDGQLTIQPNGELENILNKNDRLKKHFQLMDQQGPEEELQQSLKQLQEDPDAVNNVITLYDQLTTMSREDNKFYGEARWRSLHLLGELRSPKAKDFLFKIASMPMPSLEEGGETRYEVEFRLRARAIAGLEKLGDTRLLTQIYNENNVLSGLAAASLSELGHPPKGIVKVDGRQILGTGDPKDYNPKKGSRREMIPSSLEGELTKGDNEPSITPKWPK